MTHSAVSVEDKARHLRYYDSVIKDDPTERSASANVGLSTKCSVCSADLRSVSRSASFEPRTNGFDGVTARRDQSIQTDLTSMPAYRHKVKKKHLSSTMRKQRSTKNILHLKRRAKLYLKISLRGQGLTGAQQQGVYTLIRDLQDARTSVQLFRGNIPWTKGELIYKAVDTAYEALPNGRERKLEWMLAAAANRGTPSVRRESSGSDWSEFSRTFEDPADAGSVSRSTRTSERAPSPIAARRDVDVLETAPLHAPLASRHSGSDAEYDSDDGAETPVVRSRVPAQIHEAPRASVSSDIEQDAPMSVFQQQLLEGKKSLKRPQKFSVAVPPTAMSSTPPTMIPGPPPPPPPPALVSDVLPGTVLTKRSRLQTSAPRQDTVVEDGPPAKLNRTLSEPAFVKTSTDGFDKELAERMVTMRRRQEQRAQDAMEQGAMEALGKP